MVLKFRRRRLKNIRGLPWKVDGVEKGRDRDMFFFEMRVNLVINMDQSRY